MSKPIEDYGFIGNMLSGALVARDGSMDWLCLPRFDSDACFAALLGTPEHGYWRISPAGEARQTRRRYLPHAPILETTFEMEDGTATLVDFMPLSEDPEKVDVIRLLRGVSGRVAMRMELALRFGYGKTVPWVRRRDYGIHAVAGPDAVELVTPVPLHGEDMRTVAQFDVSEGDIVPFTLAYHPLHREPHFIGDGGMRLERTAAWWAEWSRISRLSEFESSAWKDAVERSLVTLKALTYRPSGGIVAALTTSLPEEIGGTRNWDYRYCWIRDATLTLYALTNAGHFAEAGAFRDWMLRAAAGAPDQMQIMYGVSGERRLTEKQRRPQAAIEGAEHHREKGERGELAARFGQDVHQAERDASEQHGDAVTLRRAARREQEALPAPPAPGQIDGELRSSSRVRCRNSAPLARIQPCRAMTASPRRFFIAFWNMPPIVPARQLRAY